MTEKENRDYLQEKLQNISDRSESRGDQITQQIKELQEVVNTLQAAQFFKTC